MTGILGFTLLVLPIAFYLYERKHNMSVNWSRHKTLMFLGAIIICLGLAVPALQRIVFLVCR